MAGRVAQLDALLRPGAGPRSVRGLVLPAGLDVLVLAPHPDDFDAIALTLRHLHGQGHRIEVAVLTTGAGGVEDGFAGANDDEAKARLREAEQRESCALFGLPPQRLHFLRLPAHDWAPLQAWLAARPADLLFLPHGNDSNRTHRRTFEAVSAIAAEGWIQAWACLNQDAKTQGMRVDLVLEFGAEDADWKARLLRCHSSQQERNLRTRRAGFDARVLEVNRAAAGALGASQPFAEVFELLRLGR